MARNRRLGSARAFTLVELLVCIGIIALLISILLPALNRARCQARLVVCMARLEQITAAINCYANESRGYFLRIDGPLRSGFNLWDISNEMYDSLRTRSRLPHKFLFCPERPDSFVETEWAEFWYFKQLGYSWWIPRKLENTVFPPPTAAEPLVWLAEERTGGPIRQGDRVANQNPILTCPVMTFDFAVPNKDALKSVHYGGSQWNLQFQNQAFADGHVERHHIAELLPRYGGSTFANWQWR